MTKVKLCIYGALNLIILSIPMQVFAKINTIYDTKLKMEQTKESIANSPIYSIALYSGGTLIIFIFAVVVVLMLIMLLKK